MNVGKKKFIIIIAIVLLILILAIGGVFAYITTDLFKSNQILFFKYIGQSLENIKYIENTQLAEIEKLKEEMPYTEVGNLSFEAGETNTDINANVLSRVNLNMESKVNKPEDKAYTKAKLNYNNQDIFTVEYANSNNIYALKSDEIVTAFLGIENDNLKVLAQKFGIVDTTAIPNSIEGIDINEIFKITDEEKIHISETYMPVLLESIKQESFSKEKNIIVNKENVTYNTTAYRLKLNEEDLKQIQIVLLQTLKEDSITLNLITTKAKLLNLDEQYTQINNITTVIDKQIKKLTNQNNLSNEGIDIIVYVDNQKVITTEIILQNEIKYTIYGDVNENTNIRNILIENLDATLEYDKIEIEQIETRNNLETTNNILINMDDNIGIDIYLTNTGIAIENSLNTTCEINISQGELASTIMYEQETNFEEEINDILELSKSNCGILNDYTTEQIRQLIQNITQRIAIILKQKKELIGWVENPQIYDLDINQIEE